MTNLNYTNNTINTTNMINTIYTDNTNEETKGSKKMIRKELNIHYRELQGFNCVLKLQNLDRVEEYGFWEPEDFDDLINYVFVEFLDSTVCAYMGDFAEIFYYNCPQAQNSTKLLNALAKIVNPAALDEEHFLNIVERNGFKGFREFYYEACDFDLMETYSIEDFFQEFVIERAEDPEVVKEFWDSNFAWLGESGLENIVHNILFHGPLALDDNYYHDNLRHKVTVCKYCCEDY